MTSSSGPLNEELQSSICLDVFSDPVSSPCGHSFCDTCLKECLDNSLVWSCPFCKETFSERPDLNTALRQAVELFKEESSLRKSEVLCDFCDERRLKAIKSCLVCQNSYCEKHLDCHQRVQRLKKHKLIDPVENLNCICQEHEKPLELFCRDDQTFLCVLCSMTDHKTHNTVSIEEESEQRKTQLRQLQTDMQQKIQDRIKKIQEIKHSAELRKNTEQERADIAELSIALMCTIETSQKKLLEMMEEKQKAAEKQNEDLIKELENEIGELKRRDAELEQHSDTKDHLHLLQIYPSLCTPLHTRNWTEHRSDTHLSLHTLRCALTQLQKTLDKKLYDIELKRIHQYAVDVTLDPDTAHPNLIISDDGKQVKHGDIMHKRPKNPARFDKCPCVLGKEGFSSGRFYYEVQVKEKTGWVLGVARESINRKLDDIQQAPQKGYWTVSLLNRGDESVLLLFDNSLVVLSLKPQKVGVFVDYEDGLISFYDVESRSYIYSFTGNTFTEKLYPYFDPGLNDNGKNSTPLIISPVNYNKK